jgi:hypothetical protein
LCITTKTCTQIQNFKRNSLDNYNDSEHVVKTKNAPFFMNFQNINKNDNFFPLDWSLKKVFRLIAEGATRFLHHQICEVAADCLQKSRDDLITCAYFCDMSTRLEETLAEVKILLFIFV